MPRTSLALLIFALVCCVSAQTSNGRKSLVPAATLNAAKKTKFRVLVPTYIPPGFKFVSGGLEVDREPILTDWRLQYTNPKTKANFTIQMASEGLGDPMFALPNGDVLDPTGFVAAKSPIMGKVAIDYARKGKYVIANCTWYTVSKKTYPRFAMILSEGMEPATVKKILESLRWLSK